MTERFTVFGNHGTLLVCAKTGLILDRIERIPEKLDVPGMITSDSWEDARAAFGNAQCDYDDIAKFNVEEWISTWAGETLNGASVDILDIGFWTHDGVYIEPEMDWRVNAVVDTPAPAPEPRARPTVSLRDAAPDMLNMLIDLLTPGSVNAGAIEAGRDLLARLGYDVRKKEPQS